MLAQSSLELSETRMSVIGLHKNRIFGCLIVVFDIAVFLGLAASKFLLPHRFFQHMPGLACFCCRLYGRIALDPIVTKMVLTREHPRRKVQFEQEPPLSQSRKLSVVKPRKQRTLNPPKEPTPVEDNGEEDTPVKDEDDEEEEEEDDDDNTIIEPEIL